mmetsp:Transcript_27185/g.73483  ORF Transcript_27185/g.73483 Transcript_27185/m.73483 type:complete len:205 (+) Transcript_27185:533-1147(+)
MPIPRALATDPQAPVASMRHLNHTAHPPLALLWGGESISVQHLGVPKAHGTLLKGTSPRHPPMLSLLARCGPRVPQLPTPLVRWLGSAPQSTSCMAWGWRRRGACWACPQTQQAQQGTAVAALGQGESSGPAAAIAMLQGRPPRLPCCGHLLVMGTQALLATPTGLMMMETCWRRAGGSWHTCARSKPLTQTTLVPSRRPTWQP